MTDDGEVRTIFILDDNDIDRETCRRYLARSSSQFRFIEHSSVTGAIDIVRRERPDCILLDYHLHDGNGVEFLNDLAGIGGTRLFPVVMLTGTGSETIAVNAMKAGAQDYLVKGRLNSELLLKTVDAAMYKAETDRLLDQQRSEMERLFREARLANARKDQFLAALSHELRTPLTPILAAVSAVRPDVAKPEELVTIFDLIRRNVELEARLIDDMLDLTRISSGKLEIDAHPVDIHRILSHAAETCHDEVVVKDLELVWHLEATNHAVNGDAARLQQVFWNLLKNAAKFTPARGQITVSTSNQPGEVVRIQIADTGIGLNAEHIEKLFDAFEQGGNEVTRRFGGLGLGLAISKALIEAHGGTVSAANNLGGPGAIFTIDLRVLNGTPDAPPIQATSEPASEVSRDGSRLCILLVEDHADTAHLLEKILSAKGYEVHPAGSVARALEVFYSTPIDLIISDIGLPDGTGIDLMETVSKIRRVPGIALSGYGMEQDLRRSLDAGFVQHLTKPIDWSRVDEVIKRILSNSSSDSASAN